jgi:thioredoxin 1
MQGPIIEEVAIAMEGKVKVGKVNVDENSQVAQKFGIMSIPTIMVFKGGTVVKQFIGVQSKETLLSELNKLIN